MRGTIYPYNEYYMVTPLLSFSSPSYPPLHQVAYMANMTTAPGSNASIHFATYMGK